MFFSKHYIAFTIQITFEFSSAFISPSKKNKKEKIEAKGIPLQLTANIIDSLTELGDMISTSKDKITGKK